MNQPPHVAVAGEALIDMLGQADGSFRPCLGGSLFNLTRALARQDVAVSYLNPLSADRFGRQLAEALRADGAQLAHASAVAAPTSLAMVSLDADGHPAYAFYRSGVADRSIDAVQLDAACAALPGLALVCCGGLALAVEDADVYLPWLASQRRAGRLVVLDVNLRPSVMPDLDAYRVNVLRAASHADILKASDEDLAVLGLSAGQLLERSGASLLAFTAGAAGACLMRSDGVQVRARERAALQLVDTVGAGDSFLAGLLAALLECGATPADTLLSLPEAALRDCLAHAIASASLNVQRQGCQPPRRAEVQAWLEQASIY